MKNIFQQAQFTRPKSNKFDLSHEKKLTMNMGDLIPCYLEEVIPGDKFRVTSQVFLRFLALIAPVMHRVDVFVHYFFVPNRLIWNEWEDFITGGRLGTSAPIRPYAELQHINTASTAFIGDGGILDYLGYPTEPNGSGVAGANNAFKINLLPLRAYQLVYDTYYRDQNLTAPLVGNNAMINSGQFTSVGDMAILFSKRKRAWEKDYLTSALPFVQRGTAVSVPITNTINYKSPAEIIRASDSAPAFNATGFTANASAQFTATGGTNPGAARIINLDSVTGAVTVNALRTSIKLQEWLERNAVGGARYIEQIAAHFGVTSSDARLQRPQYLGGGKQPVTVSEVLSTAPPTSVSALPLATMGGNALSIGSTNSFSKFFEEHGFVIGIISVLPKTAYQNAMPKWNMRDINTDYYFPEFAHLGEQSVLYKEVFFKASLAGIPDTTWGYQSRYAEYKYSKSTVHGQFRSTLAYWHLGRIFTAAPNLNTGFIEADPRTDIFAVTGQLDNLVVQIYHSIQAMRPIPYFGTPKF